MINFGIILSTVVMSILTLASPSFGSNESWENDENLTPHRQHIKNLEAQIRKIPPKAVRKFNPRLTDTIDYSIFSPISPRTLQQVLSTQEEDEKKQVKDDTKRSSLKFPTIKGAAPSPKNQTVLSQKPSQNGQSLVTPRIKKPLTERVQQVSASSQLTKSPWPDMSREEFHILLKQLHSLGFVTTK